MRTRIRVLMVEASEADALLLVQQLEREGYQPTFERVDTPQALRAALESRPWDLVLADDSLTSLSAAEALALVDELALDLPFILVSGSSDEARAAATLRAGAHDLIIQGNWARFGPAIARELSQAEARRQARVALANSEERLRALIANSADAILLLDPHGTVESDSPAATNRILGYAVDELVGRLIFEFVHPDDLENVSAVFGELVQSHVLRHAQFRIRHNDGSWRWMDAVGANLLDLPAVGAIVVNAIDITERKQAEAALADSEARYRTLFESVPVIVFTLSAQGAFTQLNPAFESTSGWSRREWIGRHFEGIVHPDDRQTTRQSFGRAMQGQVGSFHEVRVRTRAGETRVMDVRSAPQVESGQTVGVTGFALDVTERRRAEDLGRLTEEILGRIQSLIVMTNRDGAVTFVNEAARDLLGFAPGELLGDQLWQATYDDPGRAAVDREGAAAVARGQRAGPNEPYERALRSRTGEWRWLLWQVAQGPGETLIAIAHDITERKRAEEQIQTQLRRLDALHTVDAAITSSLDVRVTLSVLLQQVLDQLGADAADVLLFRPPTQSLEYVEGRGFRSGGLERTPQRLGEGHAGRAALARRTVRVPDLRQAAPQSRRTGLLVSQEFVSYFGVPLVAKGQLQGVLEVFHRTPFNPDAQWLSFLEALASQAAIAIDNALLFDEVQRSNTQLALAYDATIEGWSRAMDLRDKETEGHTRRVTELTVLLARALGLPEEEIVHLRRGALLHDIGKMGVPDAILLKPGPLTDAEWAIMRQHPTLAYEMLAAIAYLRPALDIPYSHHEKWDGTGYPRQLKGEAIPLSARIFAVADVWDALRSDRPYRPAWPEAKVRDQIRALSGTHFDPRVVNAFLRLDKLPE
jgi:PAS domain S-box-containing protein/putative nucleotidyltransferase with HDIG domain